MRCPMTTKAGKQCRWPGRTMVGGIMVCEYHIRAAERLYLKVHDSLPEAVRLAAERDTYERNSITRERYADEMPDSDTMYGPPGDY